MELKVKREKEILNFIVEILKNHFNPCRIILFGSRCREDYNHNADFDIAVESKKPGIRKHRKVIEEIEKVSGLYKVDLVYLKSIEDDFKKVILSTGKTLYESKN